MLLPHQVGLQSTRSILPCCKRQTLSPSELLASIRVSCVPVKTDYQLELQALHRVRSRLVGQRTAVINQIRSFLLERGIAVRQGPRFLRRQLPEILAKRIDVLSPRMIGIIEDPAAIGGISMSASSVLPRRSNSWHTGARVAGN